MNRIPRPCSSEDVRKTVLHGKRGEMLVRSQDPTAGMLSGRSGVYEECARIADAIERAYLRQAQDTTERDLVERYVALSNVARTIAEEIRGAAE